MKKTVIILSAIIIAANISCTWQSKKQTTTQEDAENSRVLLYNSMQIDSVLDTPNLYCAIQLDNPKLIIDLPYNYFLDGKATVYGFQWQVGDLVINSDSANYDYVGFSDNIPYKGYTGYNGRLHFVKTSDSLAVSTGKFIKSMQEDSWTEILYTDENSVIYKTHDTFYTLYFKYLNEIQLWAIYLNDEAANGYEATPQELFDLSLTRLRLAKNLFQSHKNSTAFDWQTYKNTLAKLEYQLFDNIRTQLNDSIDFPASDEIFMTKLDGNYQLVSMIKNPETLASLSNSFNTIPENSFVQQKKIFDRKSVENIAFLRGDEDKIKITHKNNQGFILEKQYEYSEYRCFSVYYFTTIKSQQVLLFTGNRYNNSPDISEKSLAFLYFEFFKSIGSE